MSEDWRLPRSCRTVRGAASARVGAERTRREAKEHTRPTRRTTRTKRSRASGRERASSPKIQPSSRARRPIDAASSDATSPRADVAFRQLDEQFEPHASRACARGAGPDACRWRLGSPKVRADRSKVVLVEWDWRNGAKDQPSAGAERHKNNRPRTTHASLFSSRVDMAEAENRGSSRVERRGRTRAGRRAQGSS